jgi:hypothetical protein
MSKRTIKKNTMVVKGHEFREKGCDKISAEGWYCSVSTNHGKVHMLLTTRTDGWGCVVWSKSNSVFGRGRTPTSALNNAAKSARQEHRDVGIILRQALKDQDQLEACVQAVRAG